MTNPADTPGVAMRAPKTAELIADQIRSKIVRGILVPGAMLPPENVLTVQLGVSRPTLREALRILETESLVVVRRGAHGGARVSAPQLDVAARHVAVLLQLRRASAVDVHVARAAIEPACARVFARRGTRVEFAELRTCADRVSAEVSSDPWTWARAAADFRRMLLVQGSSSAMAMIGELIVDLDCTQTALDATPLRAAQTAQACVELAALITRRRSVAAAIRWQKHLTDLPPSDVPLESVFA